MLLFFLYILDKYTTYIKFCYKNNEYSVEYPWYMLDPPLLDTIRVFEVFTFTQI